MLAHGGHMHRQSLLLRFVLLFALSAAPWIARASGCVSAQPAGTGMEAAKIAAIACRENTLWYSPFIDSNGRLASNTVSEAEGARLGDGATPAWMRVVEYWRGSGLLSRMQQFAGASDCSYVGGGGYSSPQCRAFVIDQPWSAAFVSWVMVQAGLPGFNPSASHFGYAGDAFRGGTSPFRFMDPDRTPAAVGDLLCYVRSNATQLGFAGLSAFLARGGGALNMHCDIVVSVQPGMLSAIGGNVLQGVTMRLVPINRQGLPWNLPRGTGANTSCWPSNPDGCSFNRHDWSVLLKLRPDAELATLPGAALPPSSPMPVPQPSQQCCVNCVVGSGIPRCPNPNAPSLLPQGAR
jgi:hypothetical protein